MASSGGLEDPLTEKELQWLDDLGYEPRECAVGYIHPDLADHFIESYEGDVDPDTGLLDSNDGFALTVEDKKVYKGELENGYFHGLGRLTVGPFNVINPKSVQYVGQFVSGVPTGVGVIFWDPFYYEGEVREGKPHGKGKVCFTRVVDGVRTTEIYYKGEFRHGQRTGKGTLYYPSEGNRYDGDLVNNVRHGHGSMHYENGSYSGGWQNDVRHGHGEYSWTNYETANEERYVGQWEDGEMNGKGEHIWGGMPTPQFPVQTRYVGDFKNGQRHGTGTMHYPNGSSYNGEWSENLKQGNGVFTAANGVKFTGTYDRNVMKEELPKEIAGGMKACKTSRGRDLFLSPLTAGRKEGGVTPLSSLLGDIGVHDCENVDMSDTFNSHVAKLMPGLTGEVLQDQMIEVHTILLRYIDHLQAVYNYYAKVGKILSQLGSFGDDRLMTRFQFWILCHDVHLHQHGCTLADLDRVTGQTTMRGQDLHNPNYVLWLRVFLQWLTYIAVAIYSTHPDVSTSRFLVATCLETFIQSDLGPSACAHQSIVFQHDSIRLMYTEYVDMCQEIYDQLHLMPSGTHRPRPTTEGEPQLPTARDFVFMMQTFGLLDDALTPTVVSNAIRAVNPSALETPDTPNMDTEITFYECLVAMIKCASMFLDVRPLSLTPSRSPSRQEVIKARSPTPPSISEEPSDSAAIAAIERYKQLFQQKPSRSGIPAVGSLTSLDGAPSQQQLSASHSQTANLDAVPEGEPVQWSNDDTMLETIPDANEAEDGLSSTGKGPDDTRTNVVDTIAYFFEYNVRDVFKKWEATGFKCST